MALYVGWQLPHREVCSEGGDTCDVTLAIDWSRVDWDIPPTRYACGVPHPIAGRNVLIGPGDVCVTANGLGVVLERFTYEELRARAVRRRIGTLMAIVLILVVTAVAAIAAGRRRSGAQ